MIPGSPVQPTHQKPQKSLDCAYFVTIQSLGCYLAANVPARCDQAAPRLMCTLPAIPIELSPHARSISIFPPRQRQLGIQRSLAEIYRPTAWTRLLLSLWFQPEFSIVDTTLPRK